MAVARTQEDRGEKTGMEESAPAHDRGWIPREFAYFLSAAALALIVGLLGRWLDWSGGGTLVVSIIGVSVFVAVATPVLLSRNR